MSDRNRQPRNSPHPSSCEGHLSTGGILLFPLVLVILVANYAAIGKLSRVQLNSVPSPHAMHDHRMSTGQGYTRLLSASALAILPRLLAKTMVVPRRVDAMGRAARVASFGAVESTIRRRRPISLSFDASRSLTALEQDNTIVAVIKMSKAKWLIAALVPYSSQQARKCLRVVLMLICD